MRESSVKFLRDLLPINFLAASYQVLRLIRGREEIRLLPVQLVMFFPLLLYIVSIDVFGHVLTDTANVEAFRPKLATPQPGFDGRNMGKHFTGGNACDGANDFR